MRMNQDSIGFRDPCGGVPPCTAATVARSASRCSKALRMLVTLVLFIGFGSVATAQVGLRFTVPGVSIGIDIPVYPRLVQVPGYPVYYASELDANFFFYDGLFWLYAGDRWYASEWYNGPWELVEPEDVPILHFARSSALLPTTPGIFLRLESPSTATLGRALGP